MSEPSGLQRLIERAYQLRIAAGIGERASRWGAVVDASRAEPYIRPRQRPQLVEPPADEVPGHRHREGSTAGARDRLALRAVDDR